MKTLYLIALLPLVVGCANTRAASARLETEAAELEAARIDLMVQRLEGKTAEEIEAAEARFEAEIEDVRSAAEAQVEAVKTDVVGSLETAVRGGASAFGLGPLWAELLGTAAAGAAATWVARDRRKRQGKDPLQRTDILTPPVVNAPPRA